MKHPDSRYPKIYFQMLVDKTSIIHSVVISEARMSELKPSRKEIESLETKWREKRVVKLWMYLSQEEMWERWDDFTSGILFWFVVFFFVKKISLFMHRYNAEVTHSFCKASCSSWRNPSGPAIRAKHSPLIHEKALQDHGEPLLPCTVFPNVDCRYPFCSTCPCIWFQTALVWPWIDWIRHAFLNCAFNWIQLHPW